MNTFKELENYYKSKSYYFIQIIKAQRYTSYIKVMTLSGLTLVVLKKALMKSSVFRFMTAVITSLMK